MPRIDIETHTIDIIPAHKRFGRPRDLFGIWFGFNVGPLGLVTGATGVALGLSVLWTAVALVIGSMVGGLAMAFHAAQGPTLGVPQMLQARGQFGLRGAAVLTAVQLFVCVGFLVSVLIVAAQSLTQLFGSLSTSLSIVVMGLASFAIASFGFRLISVASKVAALGTGILSIAAVLVLFTSPDASGPTLFTGGFDFQTFFLMVSISASWQIAFAPCVSDYSRYLPAKTGPRAAFWYTYLGCALGAMLMMILGAVIASTVTSTDPLAGLAGIGIVGKLILGLFVVSGVMVSTVNSYSGLMCTATVVSSLRPGRLIGTTDKFAMLIGIYVVSITLALAGSTGFTTHFITFIYLCMYLLVPWSAINLADYYIVRRGHYDVTQFFLPHAGTYGNWNAKTGIAFLIGFVSEIPFITNELYTGPIADRLGGIDFAWIVGFIVSGAVFLVITKSARSGADSIEPPLPPHAMVTPR